MAGEMTGEMAKKKADVKSDGVPNDVFHEILLRLPAKSIAKCRCVSKSWLSITTSPSFLFAHTSRSPHSLLTHSSTCKSSFSILLDINLNLLSPAPSPPDGRIVASSALPVRRRSMSEVVFASCDGLICLCEIFVSTIEKDEVVPCYYLNHRSGIRIKINEEKVPCYYVLNPLTGSRIDLPKPNRYPGDIMGLYFHPPTCEYRLIRRIYSNYFDKVQLLPLGGEAWRTIEASPPGSLDCGKASINLKGNLYWIAYNVLIAFGVLAFDTLEEEFKLFPMPPGDKQLNASCCLIEIGESLGLSIVDNKLNSEYELGIDIWFLKDDKWEKMHSVKCSGRPGSPGFRLCYSFDDIALFNKEELKVYFFGRSYFVRFDLQSKKFRTEKFLDPQGARHHYNHLYKESLVSYDSFHIK